MIQKIISPPHSWHDHESPLCLCVYVVTWLANVLHIKLSGDTSGIAAGFNVPFNAIYFNNNVYQGKTSPLNSEVQRCFNVCGSAGLK